MNSLIQDLRVYVGESGGTHGLDDVTNGIVYLKAINAIYYPHCKLHGAMIKVSNDGIWRCAGTTRNCGCYYPN